MAARKQKQKQRRMSAQVVEDEDYQLRYEIVAGIDVAKDRGMVCIRLPTRRRRGSPDNARSGRCRATDGARSASSGRN